MFLKAKAVEPNANGFCPFLLEFRETWKSKATAELAEKKPCEGAEDEASEAIKDAAVVLLRWLRRHEVDGLRGNLVVLIGHDSFLSSCRC